MYACAYETESGFFAGVCAPRNATAIFCDPPYLQHKDRSPGSGTPAQRGSLAALTWTAL